MHYGRQDCSGHKRRDQRAYNISGYQDPVVVSHDHFGMGGRDDFVDSARPAFEATGVQLVDDVELFEHLKLRMLNGTHSFWPILALLQDMKSLQRPSATNRSSIHR